VFSIEIINVTLGTPLEEEIVHHYYHHCKGMVVRGNH